MPDSSPQLAHRLGFTVVGPSIRTTNKAEMSGDGKIGALWAQFMQTDRQNIPAVIEQNTLYAVYTNYDNNETGPYDLILGERVKPDQQAPALMKSIAVPAAEYIVFSVHGSSPDAIRAAWIDVYRFFSEHTQHSRAFTADFEQHSPSKTRIFIAIR